MLAGTDRHGVSAPSPTRSISVSKQQSEAGLLAVALKLLTLSPLLTLTLSYAKQPSILSTPLPPRFTAFATLCQLLAFTEPYPPGLPMSGLQHVATRQSSPHVRKSSAAAKAVRSAPSASQKILIKGTKPRKQFKEEAEEEIFDFDDGDDMATSFLQYWYAT